MYESETIGNIEDNLQYAKATESVVTGSPARIEQLLEANLDYVQKIHADTQRIRQYMRWRIIMTIFLIVVTVAPFVVAAFYLPPLLKQIYSAYSPVLSGDDGTFNLLQELQKVK